MDSGTSISYTPNVFDVTNAVYAQEMPIIGLNREGRVSDDSDTHPMKQPSLMTLTEDEIVIDNRDEHPKKHCSPMTLTEDEMDTEGID